MGDGLARAFRHGRPALVVYLMAGFPDRDASLACVRAATDAGADLVELGVPYGDPLADGRVIRDAGRASLAGGFGLEQTLELASEIAGGDSPPIALMTYYNPMLQCGLAETAAAAREAGVEGFIIPDLPPDAADEWLAVSDGLDTVFLVAPTSTDGRLDLVGERSSGFVYAVSSLGVTGERAVLSERLPSLVARMKERTELPVAVGFGVGTPARASEVAAFADGVVVGSAIVQRQQEGPHSVQDVVTGLATAVHQAG